MWHTDCIRVYCRLLPMIFNQPGPAQVLREEDMKKKLIVGALMGGLASFGAQAGSVYLNVGTSYDGTDGDSLTSSFEQFGFTGTLGTSFYGASAGATGTASDMDGTVIDTNIQSRMNALGFDLATQTTIDGSAADFMPVVSGTQSYQYPTDPDQMNVDALNFISSWGDTEKFNAGDGLGWRLVYEYDISGTIGGGAINYTDGFFNIFFEDMATATRTQVFQLEVTSSETTGVSLNLFGNVDYDFDDDGFDDAGTLAQNFLWDVDSGKSYYELWASSTPPELSFRLDTNVDPAIAGEDTLVDGNEGTNQADYFYRQLTLDGSIIVNVPEPATIALLGMGLIGLGASTRRRRNNNLKA